MMTTLLLFVVYGS